MTTVHSLQFGEFDLLLDPTTTERVAVLPDPSTGVIIETGASHPDQPERRAGPDSVHAAGFRRLVKYLDTIGWELSDDEGDLILNEETETGRPIVGPLNRNPVIAEPDFEMCVEASDELMTRALRYP